jgi:hypothetical protein
MANINLYDTYNNKRRKFGVNDSVRFQDSFVDAVNLTNGELNNLVFQDETLSMINSFDDIIDNRLISFADITFDAASNVAIEGREFWSAEYDFERLSDTNEFVDTLDDGADIILSISNGVFSIVDGVSLDGTVTLPDVDVFTLVFESHNEGNRLLVNGIEYGLTYTAGDATTTVTIGTLNATTGRIISATTGYTLNRVRFLSSATAIYDFLINEGGIATALIDEIAEYVATVDSPVWKSVYIEPSSGLSTRYVSPFSMAIDYHLQDGGEWAIEAEPERERKWYGRGIQNARNTFQNTTTYTNPLGI